VTLVDHVIVLLEKLAPADFEPLAPAERRRFADACARVVRLAQVEHIVAEAREATSGILLDLHRGERAE
jgi:hypothetical protein